MLRIFQILTFVLHQQEEICLCDCENTVGGTPWSGVRAQVCPWETHATERKRNACRSKRARRAQANEDK